MSKDVCGQFPSVLVKLGSAERNSRVQSTGHSKAERASNSIIQGVRDEASIGSHRRLWSSTL